VIEIKKKKLIFEISNRKLNEKATTTTTTTTITTTTTTSQSVPTII